MPSLGYPFPERKFNLSHLRFLAVLVALGLTAGCKAQTQTQDSALNRRIEVTVRTQFSVPQDYNVILGARKPSSTAGYDELPITFASSSRSQAINFLISKDGTKLARLETFDLTKEPGSDISVAGRPIRGNPAAKVTIISFDDLECPFCARMHQSLFPATLDRYKDQIRFIYKDFPLTENHPWAMHASVDANCLAAQNGGVYWSYVDYLHSHGEEVTGADRDLAKSAAALDRIARQEAALGKLDSAKLDACLAKQDETEINSSLKEASALGLEGAPALFVNGERVNGAVPEEQVWMAIDRALRAEGEQPPPAPAKTPATPAPLPPAGPPK
jgi:protein-disulfide isomerase